MVLGVALAQRGRRGLLVESSALQHGPSGWTLPHPAFRAKVAWVRSRWGLRSGHTWAGLAPSGGIRLCLTASVLCPMASGSALRHPRSACGIRLCLTAPVLCPWHPALPYGTRALPSGIRLCLTAPVLCLWHPALPLGTRALPSGIRLCLRHPRSATWHPALPLAPVLCLPASGSAFGTRALPQASRASRASRAPRTAILGRSRPASSGFQPDNPRW